LCREGFELFEAGQDPLRRAAAREPAVAVVDDSLQRVRGLTAEQDGRTRLLRRLRPRPDRIEVDELAVELWLVLRPDLLHGQHLLAHLLVTGLEGGAVVLHLLCVPPGADAEEDLATREQTHSVRSLGRS